MIQNILFKDINLEQFYNIEFPSYEENTIEIISNNNKTLSNNQYHDLPKTYCWENVKMKQKFWSENEIDFKLLGEKLNMSVKTVCTTMQPPGSILPPHIDSFFKLKKEFSEDKKFPVRANIFLEDWKIGHFLQFEDKTISHWSKGQGFMWDGSVIHLSANAGLENKFTLQVSGFLETY